MATITEDFVSFAVSKLLKEKGFDIPCNCYGAYNGVNLTYRYCITDKYTNWNKHTDERIISCPTLQMAMKWLREVHGIFIAINIVPNTTVTMEQRYYFFKPYKNRRIYNFPLDYSVQLYKTYEQACEAAIKYSLENLI